MVDPASFLVCYGFVFFMLLTHYSPAEMGKAFRTALERTPSAPEEIRKAIVFFDTMFKLALLGGFLGTLLGWITIAALQGSAITSAMIGRAISASLLTTFYALILAGFVALPFLSALKKKQG